MSNPKKRKKLDKKTWIQTLEKFKLLPPPEMEETEQCYHVEMTKIIKDDFLYQCKNCHCVFEVYGSAMYTPMQYAIKSLTINHHLSQQQREILEVMQGFMEEAYKTPEAEVKGEVS